MKKIPSRALFITMVVILIVTTITSMFLLFFHLQERGFDNTLVELQQTENIKSAITLALNGKFPLQPQDGEPWGLDLFGDGLDTVTIQYSRWGVYCGLNVTSRRQSISKKRSALLGFCLTDTLTALVLADKNNPLVMTGKSQITGNCFLPKQGYKKAYLEGDNYSGEDLLGSGIEQSEEKLAPLDMQVVDEFKTFYTDNASGRPFRSFDDVNNDSITNSFFSQAILIVSPNIVRLNNFYAKGKIIIYSEKAIYVSSSSRLENVILIAPTIKTADNVRGCFQAFASDSLIIGKRNNLYYPTALLLTPNDSSTINPFMKVDSSSLVSGSVICYETIENKTLLKTLLAPLSIIKGDFYSNGLVCASGTVNGISYINQFYLKTPRGYYLNYIRNATFNRKKLHHSFVSNTLYQKNKQLGIIKWLNEE